MQCFYIYPLANSSPLGRNEFPIVGKDLSISHRFILWFPTLHGHRRRKERAGRRGFRPAAVPPSRFQGVSYSGSASSAIPWIRRKEVLLAPPARLKVLAPQRDISPNRRRRRRHTRHFFLVQVFMLSSTLQALLTSLRDRLGEVYLFRRECKSGQPLGRPCNVLRIQTYEGSMRRRFHLNAVQPGPPFPLLFDTFLHTRRHLGVTHLN